ncbi:hypothetical protein CALVIDRAFT_558003 [Calocera viscosa TUFC12733]|uniref:Uncharacterized protein n=1 Tax=Calocera viscosa (strain TUFC12733) TaxID=1330018 RepID=A0A167HJH6_CALVF|nr:hypothetical protein CALVIDRAFT_558003 [Calocera viscosa TUFC12733]
MAPVLPRDLSIPSAAEQLLRSSEHIGNDLAFLRMQEEDAPTAYLVADLEDLNGLELEKSGGTDDMLVEVPILSDGIPTLPNPEDLPTADEIVRAIQDWFVQLFQNLSGVGSGISDFLMRYGKLIGDNIGSAAGQVEEFVRAHPREIALAVGGVLLTVAAAIFASPALLGIIGLGLAGPVAGGLFAVLQSIAMTGGIVLALNVQIFAVLACIIGLGLILYSFLHG